MLVRRFVLCMASCAIVGPFHVLHAQQPTDARAGYDATVRKFQQYFKRGDANAAGALYTDDVLMVEEDGTRTKSRAAAVRFLRDMFAGMTVKDFTVKTAEFHGEGRVAYATGTEHLAATDKKTGQDMTEDVQFLTVFREDPDSVWRLQYLMETPMPKAKTP